MGFTDVTLQEHVTAEHQDTNFEVVMIVETLLFHATDYQDINFIGLSSMCCNARWRSKPYD